MKIREEYQPLPAAAAVTSGDAAPQTVMSLLQHATKVILYNPAFSTSPHRVWKTEGRKPSPHRLLLLPFPSMSPLYVFPKMHWGCQNQALIHVLDECIL